jgi:succinylglutamate desuccinylase
MEFKRKIASYTGEKRGPLLICLGGIHGNEWAGVKAIDLMGKMLEVEPITNPDFCYSGRFVGLIGNVEALKKNRRFLDVDLNRSFHEDTFQRIQSLPLKELNSEEREIAGLLEMINAEIEEYDPELTVILDLHTTTAGGGIFVLTTEDPESIRIGVELHAPVITGFLKGVDGTTMHFFTPERFGRKMITVVFEGGQHDELLSVNRSIAAITNCMRTIGSVDPKDVENQHDHLLREFSKGLPKVAKLVMNYRVRPGEEFIMLPSFRNFQRIHRGQVLAYSHGKPILAKDDGLIIMPKYQEQGNDGFFVVEPVKGY